jgi:hypothetical protein
MKINTYVQILSFWTLSVVLSLYKNRPIYYSEHNVSETGFRLRLQVKLTGDRGQLYRLVPTEYVLPEDGDTIQFPKRCIL